MSLLLVVDVQNDFCAGGALAVPQGEKVVPIINQLRSKFARVIFTQDWHPANHLSFAANHPGKREGDIVSLDGLDQILWPVHCVQGSAGAQLHPNLVVKPLDQIFKKGTDPRLDSYSAFFDNAHRKSTGLGEHLRATGIREITLCGVATDYCVKYSALDAIESGFRVNIVAQACRGIDRKEKDSEKALEELKELGARLVEAK